MAELGPEERKAALRDLRRQGRLVPRWLKVGLALGPILPRPVRRALAKRMSRHADRVLAEVEQAENPSLRNQHLADVLRERQRELKRRIERDG